MKIAITGANGFIGQAIAQSLKTQGLEVISLCRLPRNPTELYFDLLDPKSLQNIPTDTDILIHAAYVTSSKDLKKAYDINMRGSQSLFRFCHAHNIKIIFISSCSAHEQSLSFYGQSKYKLEKYLSENDAIIRPGFVVGSGGIYKRIEETIRKMKFVPLFWKGNQKIQIIALSDLIACLHKIVTNNLVGSFNCIHPQDYSIKDFYSHIFRHIGLKPIFIYLPGDIILFFLKLCEKLKILLPVSSENLLGIKKWKVFESNISTLASPTKTLAEALEEKKSNQHAQS